MMFSLSGLKSEKFGDKTNAFNMYNQTLLFIKWVEAPPHLTSCLSINQLPAIYTGGDPVPIKAGKMLEIF
jgi:hypothetical protein